MDKFRPLLAAFLGLTLWVQGFAIAAAPIAPVEVADAAAGAMEMPCHGDEAPSLAPCDCCDDDCPGMSGCATGSFAAAPVAPAQAEAPLHAAIATRGWSSQTTVLSLSPRPPIVSHA